MVRRVWWQCHRADHHQRSAARLPPSWLAALRPALQRGSRQRQGRAGCSGSPSPMASRWGGSWAQSQEVAHLEQAEGTSGGGSCGRARSRCLRGSRRLSASLGWGGAAACSHTPCHEVPRGAAHVLPRREEGGRGVAAAGAARGPGPAHHASARGGCTNASRRCPRA